MEGGNALALDDICNHLLNVIIKVQWDMGTVMEILIIEDFN
jgi:hypothetical protein